MAPGGAERVAATLANFWCDTGWTVAVVTTSGREWDFYRLREGIQRWTLDADVTRLGNSGIVPNLRRIARLRRVLVEFGPDVSLSMMDTSNVLLALAGISCRTAAIGSERVHPPMVPLTGAWAALRKWSYRYLDAVAALTSDSASWLSRNTGAQKVAVIPNPVSLPLPVLHPIVSPRSVGSEERRRLFAIGRLTEQKGFDLLLAAFARVAGQFPNWELVIGGEGPLRPMLEESIGDLRLRGRAFLAGQIGNVGEWYQSAHAFVLSSRFEGFPNVLAEAMAHGLPAVSFDCETGPRDIISDGQNGLLVRAGDAEALAAALARLMDDDQLRSRLGARALEVRDRLSMERISSLWEQLFREVQA
jgi:glycosyltransferase involved in cell wall biosynthesis